MHSKMFIEQTPMTDVPDTGNTAVKKSCKTSSQVYIL